MPQENMFLEVADLGSAFLPGAEGLVPLNPQHWPSHAVATAVTSNMDLIENPPLRMLDNIETTLAYASTASSVTKAVERGQEILFDTTVISMMHEICPTMGGMIAGDYANQATDSYIEQAVKNRLDPNLEDDLAKITRTQTSILSENSDETTHSFELKLRGPKQANPYLIRKSSWEYVGLAAENLTPADKNYFWKNLFTQPRRSNSRPLWSYKPFKTCGGATAMVFSYSRLPLVYLARKYKSRILYSSYKILNQGLSVYFMVATVIFITNQARRQYYFFTDKKFLYKKLKSKYEKIKLTSRLKRKTNPLF